MGKLISMERFDNGDPKILITKGINHSTCWPDCIVEMPHIIADPCKPRWVVRCEHDFWFWYGSDAWLDKRDELGAYVALLGLRQKVEDHQVYSVGSGWLEDIVQQDKLRR
jgi:hypothetical protein